MPASPPAPSFESDEVERQIDAILARPEFQEPPEPVVQRILEWIFERIADVIGALSGGGRGSLIGWLIVLAAVAVVVVVARRLGRGIERRPRPVRGPDDVGRSAAEWRADAEAHEARGEWRQALRCRYRALVSDLADRGVVEEVPGRTAGEYRRAVARNVPDASTEFGGVTELFEAAWYGNRDTGPEEIDHLRSLSDRVLTGVPR